MSKKKEQVETEKWQCTKCQYPCTIEISFSDPTTNQERFRYRPVCPCFIDEQPDWQKIK